MTAPTPELVGPGKHLERDRWGRPLIVPPEGGKPVPYTRATTIAGTLDDLNGLMGWKQRMTAIGVTDRADLQIAIAAHRDDKKRMGQIVNEAMDAAAASAAATTGTALHAFTEHIDTTGQIPDHVPPAFLPDLAAYQEAVSALTPVHIEQTCVVDRLRVAGTPDRIVEYQGELFVADVKTGSIDFPGKIALQLALYANAVRYDAQTGERHPWDPARPVNKDRAIIIHLPAGTGTCELRWVDIARGSQGVDLAMKVREWRSQARTLTSEFIPAPLTAVEAGTARETAAALTLAIEAARSVKELEDLWANNQATWTDTHTAAAAARKTSLTASAA